ncbi:MAG: H4MPT-linked C1 transfer pathway protein [Candidatus Methanoperedens sp.]|nr:H4MPT-linked C1 transfer pathway protein [Candidatus Methanoperedens sp.]MCE8427559.1 H4MPT-linked C1 transfer pathway protein [Candidatus Methanoperedens sp.]
MILGIDIGGANTKIASGDGKLIELHYLPLWKNSKLPQVLHDIAMRFEPERVGVVITGELADCFTDKDTGLSYIINAANKAFKNAFFLESSGNFTKEKKHSIAAANWMASALIVARDSGDRILVDTGSTTTDIIPIKHGKPQAAGTDFERLKRSELVYTGALRTNIATILDHIIFSGAKSRISSELFAITADAYIVLGMISQDDYTCDTPDGAGKKLIDAKRRLARSVCADLSEIGDLEIIAIARQVMEKQERDIADGIHEVARRHDLNSVVACGLGEFLIKKAADRIGFEIFLISEKYGAEISKVFPAYAVARLLQEMK